MDKEKKQVKEQEGWIKKVENQRERESVGALSKVNSSNDSDKRKETDWLFMLTNCGYVCSHCCMRENHTQAGGEANLSMLSSGVSLTLE